ncbi:hypothetical protein RHSP_69047 [Rhizobium freirei PRF 81]|uniref:Uncharacterized protein n=1 Tax=Rhizobium freirei PRF 81 TaxID=363754 RepID=N6USJ7_9HYPH|nr:hypothetical protein RHSP_69047 [Rhizobium freirei PRF 81]
MCIAIWLRHQHPHVLAAHFRSRITEQFLRSGTEGRNRPGVVDDDHGFRNRIENRAQMRLPLRKIVLSSLHIAHIIVGLNDQSLSVSVRCNKRPACRDKERVAILPAMNDLTFPGSIPPDNVANFLQRPGETDRQEFMNNLSYRFLPRPPIESLAAARPMADDPVQAMYDQIDPVEQAGDLVHLVSVQNATDGLAAHWLSSSAVRAFLLFLESRKHTVFLFSRLPDGKLLRTFPRIALVVITRSVGDLTTLVAIIFIVAGKLGEHTILHDPHGVAADRTDDPSLRQLGHRPGNGLDRQAEIISNVEPGHRQFDDGGVPPETRPRLHLLQQECAQSLLCILSRQQHHLILGGSHFVAKT